MLYSVFFQFFHTPNKYLHACPTFQILDLEATEQIYVHSQTSTSGHPPTTASQTVHTFQPTDSPYLHSYFNLYTTATKARLNWQNKVLTTAR